MPKKTVKLKLCNLSPPNIIKAATDINVVKTVRIVLPRVSLMLRLISSLTVSFLYFKIFSLILS